MTELTITQRHHDFQAENETIVTVNGCNIIYCLFKDGVYHAISWAARDNGKVVATGSDWEDLRKKAQEIAPKIFAKHAKMYGL